MAECGDSDRDLTQLFEEAKQRLNREKNTNEQGICFGRPGAQLEDKLEFRSKDGKSVWVYPVLVDFRRLLELGQITETSGVIPGISNQSLLHAVVGLLDTNLWGMDTDCIYDAVSEKWARTVVLVRDKPDTIRDMTEHKKRKKEEAEKKKEAEKEKAAENANENNNKEESDTEDESDEEDDEVIDPENDVLEEEDEMASKFEDVFSDTDDEEEEEEDSKESDEEPNFTKGVKSFILSAKQRRKERDNCEDEMIKEEHIGIENMLMGCASFEKKILSNQKERVIHLTFLGVRRRAQNMQMGRYLVNKCLDPSVVGHYDAVVVHADCKAVDFFKKFGFTDDWLLNSKWNELADVYTQCILMSYVPGYSLTDTAMIEVNKILKDDPEISELEENFKKWQLKSLEAYQSQALCMKKMQHEVLKLKCVVKKQSDIMDRLMEDNELLRKGKLVAEREFLKCKLETARSAYKAVSSNGDVTEQIADCFDDDISTDQLIRSLERHAIQDSSQHRRLSPGVLQSNLVSTTCDEGHYVITGSHVRSQTTPYDHAEDVSIFSEIATCFKQSMSADLSIKMQYEVTSISKALLPTNIQEKYQNQLRNLAEPTMTEKLYYCGTLERPHRCQELLSGGFTAEDFSYGEYGHGLYFSLYPSKAVQFSALGKVLLVEVALGQVETVTKEDRTRKVPSSGFDSILTPGRLSQWKEDQPMCQEYVVFNIAQVLPVCLLTYQAVTP